MNPQVKELLKRDYKTLDLYEIADILEEFIKDNVNQMEDADEVDDYEKDKFSLIRKEIRDNLLAEGKKPTESLLEDLVRTSEKWKESRDYMREVRIKGKLLKEAYKKWSNRYTARLMQESKQNKAGLF